MEHIPCRELSKTWKRLDLLKSKEEAIDYINQQNIKEKEQYWRYILNLMIALIEVLANQNLVFCVI